jgi:hypothetical protein
MITSAGVPAPGGPEEAKPGGGQRHAAAQRGRLHTASAVIFTAAPGVLSPSRPIRHLKEEAAPG